MRNLVLIAGLLIAPAALAAGSAEKGKAAFVKHGCWQCHGYVGQGGVTGPRLAQTQLSVEALSAFVRNTRGGIGYVENIYATQNHLITTQLQNRAGQFVQPDDDSFAAAAANARWDKAPGFYEVLTDQPGAKSWPMTGASFILLHTVPTDPAKTAAVLAFFDWAFKNGGNMATELDYVAMPATVVKLIEGAWRAQIKTAGGELVWNR